MTWLRKASHGTERTLFMNTVRLCFAPTITKKQIRIRESEERIRESEDVSFIN